MLEGFDSAHAWKWCPSVGILDQLAGIEASDRRPDLQRDARLLVRFNRNCLHNVLPGIGMSDLYLIGPGGIPLNSNRPS